jgi:DNA-directed RNA polymerase subunit F
MEIMIELWSDGAILDEPMSEPETKKLLESMKEQVKEITSSKERAVEFLQEAGILDKKENFTPQYRELGKACTAHTQD